MAQKTTPKKPMNEDPRFAQAVQNYEAGLRAMQEHKFDKAKSHLQKVIAGPSKELTDRASVHMNACSQHLERSTTQFKTSEEHYDYAVSLMNVGDYVSAREHLEKLPNKFHRPIMLPTAWLRWMPHRPLGRFSTPFGPSHPPECVDPFQARNDSDFQNLSEDPRFTELLYPVRGLNCRRHQPRPRRFLGVAPLVSTEQSSRALRVVAIGGGTGLSTILRGLKRYAAFQANPFPLPPPHGYRRALRCGHSQ